MITLGQTLIAEYRKTKMKQASTGQPSLKGKRLVIDSNEPGRTRF